jgi:two-component response regulator (ARR-A family)
LEDGAEEFFLKPVKLADMKKLKSHLVRRKQPQEKPQPVAQQQKPAEPLIQNQKPEHPRPEQAPTEEPAEEAPTPEAVAVSECSSKKRKAAAIEPEVLPTPVTTNPRLPSSGLAVET